MRKPRYILGAYACDADFWLICIINSGRLNPAGRKLTATIT
jgi:hypothetical protein